MQLKKILADLPKKLKFREQSICIDVCNDYPNEKHFVLTLYFKRLYLFVILCIISKRFTC